MIKNLEHISDTKKRLTVEVPSDVIENKIKEELRKAAGQTRLPGFRPGKAPLPLLEKRFGERVKEEVINKVVPEYYKKAMNVAKLSPVSHPEFEKQEHERKNPLEMIFTVEVLPEIPDLTYEGLKVKARDAEVTDEEIETTLKRVQAEKMSYDSVDRAIEDDDLVTLDYTVVEDGKEYKGEIFKIGTEQFPRELSDHLKGRKAGDSFEVALAFPEDHVSDFKGRTVTFKGEVRDVKILKVPDIDDKLAQDSGFDNLAALKDSLKADLSLAKRNQIKKKQIVELIEQLVASHQFSVPEGMLESELSSLLTSAKMKEENKGKDEETLGKELAEEAEENARAAVLLLVIGDKENINVTEEEMKEKILELSHMTQIPPQNLVQMYMSKDGSLEGLRYGVFKEKVADLIHAKAVIEKGE